MLDEPCRAKLQEKLIFETCPECGEEIEMAATDLYGICGECGAEIQNHAMDCIYTCDNAVRCVGEEAYRKAREEEDFLMNMEEFRFLK